MSSTLLQLHVRQAVAAIIATVQRLIFPPSLHDDARLGTVRENQQGCIAHVLLQYVDPIRQHRK